MKERLLVIMARIKKGFSWKKCLYWFLMMALVLSVFGFVVMTILFVKFSSELPTPNKVVRRDGFTSQMYDRNGALLYDVYKDAKRTPVVWTDVPDYLKKATVAVEDKAFYTHQGFDPLTPFRMVKNFIVLKQITGGSTLTQQLVKNVLLTSDKSITRKIKEFILSVQIERKYTKDEILLMYLNEAPYGGAAWGVGTAADQYFGKSIKELTLEECAILAGMPQRPNVYSPFSKTPKAYIDRTFHVLERMREDNYITTDLEAKTKVLVTDYKFDDSKSTFAAPHFVFWVKDILTKTYGADVVEGGGLKITTTLDLALQQKVEGIMTTEIDKAEKLGISNGAAVVMDPTNGQVLAMVGSRGYNSTKTDGKFNVVTQGLRQPGSTIKPVTYLTAIKKGYTASSMIMDTPVTFLSIVPGQKDYTPQNYNGKFNGPMSIRHALGNSINTIAVKTLAMVGINSMLQTAFDMGLTTLEPTAENLRRFGLAVTLGGGEVKMIDLASAYGAFAANGVKHETVGVLKVEDRNGRVLEEYKNNPGKQVMTAQEAFIISNILQDNSARELTFGAVNGLIVPNYQVAVKTGTTNDKRDNWAIGWTPNLLVAAWVGNNDNSQMLKVASGVSGATPIWKQIMQYGLSTRPKVDFSIPDKIVNIEVDKISGYAAHDGFPARGEYFIDGTQPKINDPIHLKLKICKGTSGLATPDDVAGGNYDEKEYFKIFEEDPVSKDGTNRWQAGIDGWVSTQANKEMYSPPTDYCRSDGLVNVGFDSPQDRSTVGSTFDIRIKTTSLKKITEVKLWIDDKEVKTWNDKPFEWLGYTLADGPHKIKVRAMDKDGNSQEREGKFGVNVAWDWSPTPTPTVTPVATNTPVVVPTIVLPSGT